MEPNVISTFVSRTLGFTTYQTLSQAQSISYLTKHTCGQTYEQFVSVTYSSIKISVLVDTVTNIG
jgi:hypothetical protein